MRVSCLGLYLTQVRPLRTARTLLLVVSNSCRRHSDDGRIHRQRAVEKVGLGIGTDSDAIRIDRSSFGEVFGREMI